LTSLVEVVFAHRSFRFASRSMIERLDHWAWRRSDRWAI